MSRCYSRESGVESGGGVGFGLDGALDFGGVLVFFLSYGAVEHAA